MALSHLLPNRMRLDSPERARCRLRQIINQISLLFWLPLFGRSAYKGSLIPLAIHQFITLRRHFFEPSLEQRRTRTGKMQEWFYYRFVRSMKHHHSPHRLTRRNFQYDQPLNRLYHRRLARFFHKVATFFSLLGRDSTAGGRACARPPAHFTPLPSSILSIRMPYPCVGSFSRT